MLKKSSFSQLQFQLKVHEKRVATKAVPILVYESMICLSASTGSASQMPGNYFEVLNSKIHVHRKMQVVN